MKAFLLAAPVKYASLLIGMNLRRQADERRWGRTVVGSQESGVRREKREKE